MILSAHQPAYLPWLGYFDKILKSDVFVFLDTVQFEKNSFINRNKVKTPQGPVWLTIPVKTKGHLSSTLKNTEIDNEQNWREKHLKTIYLNYKKAKFFEDRYPKIESLYDRKYDLLSELCFAHLSFWLHELEIEKKIVRSSEILTKGEKSDLILNLCKDLKADTYISGALGRNYLNEADFTSDKIKVEFQEFTHPQYSQLHGDFTPFMGVVDFWMNCDDYTVFKGANRD